MNNDLRDALRIYHRSDGWHIWDPTIQRDVSNASGPMTFACSWQAIALCYNWHFTFAEPTA